MNSKSANLKRSCFPTIVLLGVMFATCGCSSSSSLDRYIAEQKQAEPAPPKPSIAYLKAADNPLAPGLSDVYRLLEAKRYQKAHDLTSRMLASDLASPEEKAEYYLFRGVTNRLMINEKSGFEDLNMSIELNSADWRAYNARRELYENRSLHEKAAEDWEKATQLNPQLIDSPQLTDHRKQGGVI